MKLVLLKKDHPLDGARSAQGGFQQSTTTLWARKKTDARIGAGDPPRRVNTMREAAPCESIQPRWKLDKAKPKPKKQTDRHSVIDNPHRGFIGWLGP
jgi:hypothetical protein